MKSRKAVSLRDCFEVTRETKSLKHSQQKVQCLGKKVVKTGTERCTWTAFNRIERKRSHFDNCPFLADARADVQPLMTKVQVKCRPGISCPEFAVPGSAGMDVRADIEQPLVLKPLARVCVPTGLYLGIPEGFEGQIRPRSGLALHHGVTVLNAPGTIDSSYRGEVRVILVNLSDREFTIEPRMRICQLVLARHEIIEWELVSDLPSTERGDGGFGHTGSN